MYDESMINNISGKVEELLEHYALAKEEIERLRNELASTKAQSEAKSAQITRLEDELLNKNIESDDLIKKIDQALR